MIYNREFRSRDLLLQRIQAQRKNRKRAAIDGVDLPQLPINGAHSAYEQELSELHNERHHGKESIHTRSEEK